MANRRMISKCLSTSKKFTELHSNSARMLYLMMIVHSDDFGRMDGSAFWIKHNIIPTINSIKEEDVEKMLVDLTKVGLILREDVEGKNVINIVNFDEHQPGLSRRTKSKFPELHRNSLNFREIHPDVDVDVDVDFDVDVERNRRKNSLFGIEYSERAERLRRHISERDPKFKITEKKIEAWANEVRLMVTADGRTLEEIDAVLEFSQDDDFWRNNILSMQKLRKQFTQLLLKSKQPRDATERRQNNTLAAIAEAKRRIQDDATGL